LFSLFYSVGSTVSKKGIAAFIFQKSDGGYRKNRASEKSGQVEGLASQ